MIKCFLNTELTLYSLFSNCSETENYISFEVISTSFVLYNDSKERKETEF